LDCSSPVAQELSAGISERPLTYLWPQQEEISRRFGENLFVRFANSDGFCATKHRIRGLVPHSGQNSDQLPLQEVLRGHVGRKKELDDLIAAFGHRLHEEYPNPERVGCPGRAALTRLANEPGSIDRSEEHTSELQSPDHLVCR